MARNDFGAVGRMWVMLGLAITLAISPAMAVIEQQSITTEISKDGQQELDLAQSLLKKHKNAQAYDLAKKVYVTQGERSLTWPQLVTVAQCADAVGDNRLAADAYWMVYHARGVAGLAAPNYAFYLERSIALAKKVPDYDKTKIAQAYLKLVSLMRADNGHDLDVKRAPLWKEAYGLLPEGNLEKYELQRRLADIEAQAQPGDTLQQIEAKNKRHLQIATEAAQSVENSHGKGNAQGWWLDVANSAMDVGDYAQAEIFIRKAMDGIGAFGPTEGYEEVLERYHRRGSSVVAGTLLDELLERIRGISWLRFEQLQWEYLIAYELYGRWQQNDKALKMLDCALAYDLTTGEARHEELSPLLRKSKGHGRMVPIPNAVRMIGRILLGLPNRDVTMEPVGGGGMSTVDDALGLAVMQKIVAAQKAALPADDERRVPALAAMGYFYHRQKDYKTAQSYYDQAFAIASKYYSPKEAARPLGKYFPVNLMEVGREKEALEFAWVER